MSFLVVWRAAKDFILSQGVSSPLCRWKIVTDVIFDCLGARVSSLVGGSVVHYVGGR